MSVIGVLLFGLCTSVRQCSDWKQTNNNNIEAFTDSIHYYQGKNDELVASKLLVIGKFNDLQKINEELYDKIRSMSTGVKPDQVISVTNTVVNELHDTTLIVKDSVANFNFENKYRALSGVIHTGNDSIGLTIKKDEVYFDYNVVLKDNKVWISSTNPYVKFNEITGLTVPHQKQKKWGIGPSVTFGYDPINNKPSFNIGIGVTYQLLQW